MDRQATIAEIQKYDPSFDAAERSDAYLAGALASHKARAPRTDSTERVERTGGGSLIERFDGGANSEDRYDASAARARMIERQSNAWKAVAPAATEREDVKPAPAADDTLDAARARQLGRLRGAHA